MNCSTWRHCPINLSRMKNSMNSCIYYYFRSMAWVGILFGVVTGIGYASNKTASAMKAVICFTVLLLVLVVLKSYREDYFENLKWFCSPGNIFLKSWISLFFYVFLIRVPYDLIGVNWEDIVSWIFQCIFGNVIALLISSYVIVAAFYSIRRFYRKRMDKDEFDIGEEVRKSVVEKIELSNPDADIRESETRISDIQLTNVECKESISVERSLNGVQTDVSINPMNKHIHEHVPKVRSVNSIHLEKGIDISREMSITMHDLSVSFSTLNNNKRGSLELDHIRTEIFTIERASCIRAEKRIEQYCAPPTLLETILESNQSDLESQSGSRNPSVKVSSTPQNDQTNGPKHVNDSDIFIPDMHQLFYFWFIASILTGFIFLLGYAFSARHLRLYSLSFQFCVTIAVFVGGNISKIYLKTHAPRFIAIIFQPVVIFFPVALFLVIFTSIDGYRHWDRALVNYLTSKPISEASSWGAGDFLTMLLSPAISSLSFSTVDALKQYYRLLSLLIPCIWIACIVITIQGALLSWAMQSPPNTALPLLARTVTTPIAVAIGDLTGASASLAAATTIMNGITSYLIAPYILTLCKVTNPISRGTAAAVSGTLLGVLAVDENGEQIAAGIGMAAYGIATIIYAMMMSIGGYRDFVIEI